MRHREGVSKRHTDVVRKVNVNVHTAVISKREVNKRKKKVPYITHIESSKLSRSKMKKKKNIKILKPAKGEYMRNLYTFPSVFLRI